MPKTVPRGNATAASIPGSRSRSGSRWAGRARRLDAGTRNACPRSVLWTIQTTAIESAPDTEEDADSEDADDEEEGRTHASTKGFSLVFDVVRRFAQPLGIHLEAWEDRIIETRKGVVRLLPVSERAELLFGKEGASAVADRIERRTRSTGPVQMTLFPEEERPAIKGRLGGRPRSTGGGSEPTFETRREATTLDRVHAAMLLQASGKANALRMLLKDEMTRGPDFLRLANALSALYPPGCEEKRLLDAMLVAVRR